MERKERTLLPGFSYSDLLPYTDAIRVATLLPGRFNDPVRLEIRNTRLSSCDRYAALSYVWGSQNDKVPITVNDRSYEIGRNLYNFLRYLQSQVTYFNPRFRKVRQKDSARAKPIDLWIDQICIDQKNLTERNHQVGNMAQIYSRAKEVIAWIPESRQGRLKGYELLKIALRLVRTHDERARKRFDPCFIKPGETIEEACQKNYVLEHEFLQGP